MTYKTYTLKTTEDVNGNPDLIRAILVSENGQELVGTGDTFGAAVEDATGGEYNGHEQVGTVITVWVKFGKVIA